MLGVGAFVAWLPTLRPYKRAAAGLLLWSMLGIAAARATGFALDGSPDRLQWFWLGAEVVLASAGALALRATAARGRDQNAQP